MSPQHFISGFGYKDVTLTSQINFLAREADTAVYTQASGASAVRNKCRWQNKHPWSSPKRPGTYCRGVFRVGPPSPRVGGLRKTPSNPERGPYLFLSFGRRGSMPAFRWSVPGEVLRLLQHATHNFGKTRSVWNTFLCAHGCSAFKLLNFGKIGKQDLHQNGSVLVCRAMPMETRSCKNKKTF